MIDYCRVRLKKLHPNAQLPVYSSAEAAGADLKALEGGYIMPGKRRLVRTGIAIELPHGFEAQIRPRSGLALQHGITILNSPGTIDSDYRGEVCVILCNAGDLAWGFKAGDRIAQIVISPVVRANFCELVDLSYTDRGESGFGSTGF